MYGMTWLLDWTHLFGGTRSREVIDEFARWTADELDYLVEARQAVLLWEHSKGDKVERIARVYRDYTTSRVLTTEFIAGIPLIEIMIAKRDGDTEYLEALAARGHDLDRIVRHLDWNMLNQVYVFGYFHADLHPANLFVLPGDAIGYVDFGIVGQLPDDVRESLTRYSWLLFRGEVEAAVRELMRWLAPTACDRRRRGPPAAHPAPPGVPVRHGRRAIARPRARTPGPIARSIENPYSKLAVDILETIRVQALSLSPSIVAYLKMLVTLGTLRHQLAVDYDLPANVRHFVRRLARQQSLALLDPRRTFDRLYAATGRMQRTLAFVEFLEAQQPVITEATSMLFGYRNRIRRVKQRLIGFGTAVLVVGGLLYLVLVFPDDTRRILPKEVDYTWFQLGLLAVLLVLIFNLVRNMRSIGSERDSHRTARGRRFRLECGRGRPGRRAHGGALREAIVTDMDTAAGEGLRRRRGGGREGHARNAAPQQPPWRSRGSGSARPRSSPPTSSSRSTWDRSGCCPRSGWTSSTPTRARSCGPPAPRRRPTRSASGSTRTWSPS